MRRNRFFRPRYVRHFPSFVSARTFADMTTWPDMKMTTLKKSKPTRYSAGPVRYSPVPAQGRLRRRLQTQRGTRMASARCGESTTDDAMAAEMNRQSSGHCNSSDDDGEAANFSPSLHKKEMLEHKYDDDDDDDGAFPRLTHRDRPNLILLLQVTTFKTIKIAKILSENPPKCFNQMVTRNQSRGSLILPRMNCCSD
jgi:hypothetical protein